MGKCEKLWNFFKSVSSIIPVITAVAAVLITYASLKISKASYELNQSMKAINNSTFELNKTVYALNNSIAQQNSDLLKGEQLTLVYDTKAFLTEYIHNILTYLAIEHKKVLKTGQYLRSAVENGNLTRKDYVDHFKIMECIECYTLSDIDPEAQFKLENYFKTVPQLKPLEPGVLDPERTKIYLELQEAVNSLSRRLSSYDERNKLGEAFWVKAYVMKEVTADSGAPIPDSINWSDVTIYGRYQLINRLKQVRQDADRFFSSFPEFKVSLRFVAIFDSTSRSFKELEMTGILLSGSKIRPIKKATLRLTLTYYKFDYYEYFVRAVEEEFFVQSKRYEDEIRSGKVKGPEWRYYNYTEN